MRLASLDVDRIGYATSETHLVAQTVVPDISFNISIMSFSIA